MMARVVMLLCVRVCYAEFACYVLSAVSEMYRLSKAGVISISALLFFCFCSKVAQDARNAAHIAANRTKEAERVLPKEG